MQNKTIWNERLFAGKLTYWFNWYLSEEGVVHYAINSILYINTLKKKYNKMYEKLIHKLELYANAVRILFKGYLLISLLLPMRLKEISDEVKKSIQISSPDYDIVIKRLHLYYDME